MIARRTQFICAIVLMGVALILGGGGSPAPLPEMALEIVAAILFAVWAACSPAPMPAVPALGWIILAALLGLPLLQLIPLPPMLWQALPGRDVELSALSLIGEQDSWRPISLAPARTVASFLAATVPAIVLLMVSQLGRSGRAAVIGAVAGVSLLGLLVGAAQMAGGEANFLRFYVPNATYLNGFQANHNSTADVLMIGMVAFAASVSEWAGGRRSARPAALLGMVSAGTALFSIGVVLTASRAGLVLLPASWIAVAVICRPWLKFSRRAAWLASITALGVLVLVFTYLLSSGVVWRVIGRFNFDNEFRPELWRDAWFAAQQFFPFGAGIGAFLPVFIAAERLEVVDATAPNRAHNELLELMVETGAIGVIVWSLIGVLIVRRAVKLLRTPGDSGAAQIYFAVAAIALIALHSQVDYPLRSMSLASVVAAAAGLLLPLPHRAAEQRRGPSQMKGQT